MDGIRSINIKREEGPLRPDEPLMTLTVKALPENAPYIGYAVNNVTNGLPLHDSLIVLISECIRQIGEDGCMSLQELIEPLQMVGELVRRDTCAGARADRYIEFGPDRN